MDVKGKRIPLDRANHRQKFHPDQPGDHLVIWLNTVEQSKRTGEVLRICREAGVMTGLPVVWMRETVHSTTRAPTTPPIPSHRNRSARLRNPISLFTYPKTKIIGVHVGSNGDLKLKRMRLWKVTLGTGTDTGPSSFSWPLLRCIAKENRCVKKKDVVHP